MDLKIPPVAVWFVCAALMLAAARLLPGALPEVPILLPLLTAGAGISTALAGAAAFRRARTTVNPLRPEQSSRIVCSGMFRYTRNPMYLGMALALCGWALYLAHWAAWPGVPLFAAYLTRFQILPEERILLRKFGEPYRLYCTQVRRWL